MGVQVLQMRSCHTYSELDMVVAKKICDRSFAFWVERLHPGIAFGGREPILICNLVVITAKMKPSTADTMNTESDMSIMVLRANYSIPVNHMSTTEKSTNAVKILPGRSEFEEL
jgi:hypothetical protein